MSFLSIATAVEKARLDSGVPFLPMLDIKVMSTGQHIETLRVVRNNEAVTMNGFEYIPAHFDITFSFETNGQGQVSLSINDFSGALRAKMEQYAGGVGFLVTLSIVNGAQLNLPPEFTYQFEVLSANAKDYRVTFSLGSESDALKVFPRNRQRRDFCRWKYKEAGTCGYTGAMPSCDFTLKGPNGCSAHGNAIRFGGFPGIRRDAVRYG